MLYQYQHQQIISHLIRYADIKGRITSPTLHYTDVLRSFNQNANINNQGSSNRNNIQNAEVVEINQPRNFKEAYGAFFANSAQRSAERFGDVLRPVRNPVQDQDIDYFDLDFDQQVKYCQHYQNTSRQLMLKKVRIHNIFAIS